MNKLLKPITIILYIVYILSAVFFVANKEYGSLGLVAISLVGTFILSFINKQTERLLSKELYIMLALFIMFSSLLGTCFNFYDINYYDDFLHLWSGIISCIVAFSIIKYFYTQREISKMSKVFLVIFLFILLNIYSIEVKKWKLKLHRISNIISKIYNLQKKVSVSK